MSVLTGFPTGIDPGTTTGTITLSPATLISQFGLSGYYATSANWSQVGFTFDSPSGGEYDCLTFHMPTLTATMSISSTAIHGVWFLKAITIIDNDSGEFVIHRNGSNFNEFNLNVPIAVPVPVNVSLFPEYTEHFSMSLWVKINDLSGPSTFFSNRSNAGAQAGLMFWQNTGNTLLLYLIGPSGGLNVQLANGGVSDNNWHHLAVTYDGSFTAAGTFFYIDGVQHVSQLASTAPITTMITDGPAVLGTYVETGGYFMRGYMDEFAFYRGLSLSQSQVTAIYNSGIPQDISTLDSASNLISWIRAETSLSPPDTDTGTIYDRFGVHDGTPINTSAGFLSSVVAGGSYTGKSMLFDGMNDYIQLAPGLTPPLLHYDPSLANGGTTHYADGTVVVGNPYWEVISNGTYRGNLTDPNNTFRFKGTGIGSDPYRVHNSNAASDAGTFQTNTLVPSTSTRCFMYWTRMTSQGDAYFVVDSAGEVLWNPGVNVYSLNSGRTNNVHSWASLVGSWHLISVYRDILSGNTKVYVDGSVVITTPTVATFYTDPDNIRCIWNDVGAGHSPPQGDIGDMWVFNTVMTDADQLFYYNTTKATYGL